MKTILFNTNTNKPVNGITRNGYYLVDGIRPQLPSNIVELEVKEQSGGFAGEWRRNGNYYEFMPISSEKSKVSESKQKSIWSKVVNIFK